MPIYEYSCRKCGEVIEKIQKFSDPPLKKHAGCGGTLTKLISQSSFQLKGSGWYVTDYAGKGKSEEKPGTDADSNGDKPKEKASAAESAEKPSSDAGGTGKKKAKGSSSSGSKTPKAG